MLNEPYRLVINQIQHLSPEEQFQLLEDLVVMLKQRTIAKPQHSILELEGLGKEIWEDINVEEYIQQERGTWEN